MKYFKDEKSNPIGEIKWAVKNIIFEAFLVALVRMHVSKVGKLYYNVSDYGVSYLILSIFMILTVTEFCVYWVHRLEHDIPFLYQKFHHIHHQFIAVTPFCGWAFHPLDAFFQALPMLCVPMLFPVHAGLHMGMTLFLSIWGISIHDNISWVPSPLFLYAAHHTIHHDKGRRKNYGQFLTLWDRVFGTYEAPTEPMPFQKPKQN